MSHRTAQAPRPAQNFFHAAEVLVEEKKSPA